MMLAASWWALFRTAGKWPPEEECGVSRSLWPVKAVHLHHTELRCEALDSLTIGAPPISPSPLKIALSPSLVSCRYHRAAAAAHHQVAPPPLSEMDETQQSTPLEQHRLRYLGSVGSFMTPITLLQPDVSPVAATKVPCCNVLHC